MSDSRLDHDLRLAVLISGGGTTLQNFLDLAAADDLLAQVVLVVSSHPAAAGIQRARNANVPVAVVQRDEFETDQEYSRAIFTACRETSADLVAMAGFVKYVPIPEDFQNRVMNIHPSLIPAFCGKGFYGLRVHQAVIDSGAKISGCTVHFVDDIYDHGPIILQRTAVVEDGDTAETLQARVFAEERRAYPAAIRLYAQGKLTVVDGRVLVAP